MCTVFTNKQTKPPTRNPQNGINRPRVICPNETVGAVPACPPGRPRSGVSIPNTHTLCAGNLTMDAPLAGRHGRAHRHRPYQSPPNRTVCPNPIGVILSIAQGWQVQRSLPWVTMQARRLPPWGLYFFSSHIITTRGEQMVSRTQIDFKKYNADGIGSPPRLYPG